MAELAAFLGVAALVIVTPGPDTALTVRSTLLGGRAAGVWTAAGVSGGQVVWAVFTAVGLASLLVGFVLAGLVGSSLTYYYTERQKENEAAGTFRAVAASHCPLQTGPPAPEPHSRPNARGVSPNRPSASALTVPQTRHGATALHCFSVCFCSLHGQCGLFATIVTNSSQPFACQVRKCLESFKPWRW